MSNETKSVSVGEAVNAIETIVNAAKLLGPETMSHIITDKLYASHDSEYIQMLAVAGETAKQIQQDAWYEANKDQIVDTKEI